MFKPTILRLLSELGEACASFHDRTMRNMRCARVQSEEIWSFVGAKQKRVPEEMIGQWGDLWTWMRSMRTRC